MVASMYALRLLLPLILLISSACSAEVSDKSAQGFWRQFRQAVVNNDKEKVADMAQFPLEVRGVDDSNPVKQYDRAGFLAIYERLVAQPVYLPSAGQIVAKSMRAVMAEKAEIVAEDFLADNAFRIEQFEFERFEGGWRFTRAYLEE